MFEFAICQHTSIHGTLDITPHMHTHKKAWHRGDFGGKEMVPTSLSIAQVSEIPQIWHPTIIFLSLSQNAIYGCTGQMASLDDSNSRPRALFRKQRKLVPDTLKRQMTLWDLCFLQWILTLWSYLLRSFETTASQMVLGRGPSSNTTGIIKKYSAELLCQWIKTRTMDLSRSDSKVLYKVRQISFETRFLILHQVFWQHCYLEC
jgi:hypothetical protein